MVVTAEARRMSREEARHIVARIWKEVRDDQMQRVWAHPFTQELDTGTLPIEMVKAYALHQWHWALEINNAVPYGFNAERGFYRGAQDVEEYVLDHVADEFSTPGPGGHQRMVDKLVEACGYTREEAAGFKCLPEMRAWIDQWVMMLSQSYVHPGVLIAESWVPDWRRIWVKSLTTHYGIKLDTLVYFTSHIEADSSEHRGGEAIGREVMSHGQGNQWVLVRALEEGRAPANYQVAWREDGKHGADGWLMWFDALYEHYDPRRKRSA